ncbi:hypothetical protein [Achromobacter insolitus]|uniref:hypothetical protein n=1 Tax=Achromobacter insolitus TaxID=217204 RepID=UPI003670A9A3
MPDLHSLLQHRSGFRQSVDPEIQGLVIATAGWRNKGKPFVYIASQAQDYSTIFANCATGFCLICCNLCNNRIAFISDRLRQAGLVARVALCACLAFAPQKPTESRRSETIARKFAHSMKMAPIFQKDEVFWGRA